MRGFTDVVGRDWWDMDGCDIVLWNVPQRQWVTCVVCLVKHPCPVCEVTYGVQAAHLGTLCGQSLPLAASLKHTLLSLVRLTGDLIV